MVFIAAFISLYFQSPYASQLMWDKSLTSVPCASSANFYQFSPVPNPASPEDPSHSLKPLVPRPPLYGIPAKTLPRGHWIFRGYAVFPHYNKMFDRPSDSMVGLSEGTSFISDSYTLKIRYGILNRLTAIVNVPYVHRRLSTPKVEKTGDGLGDVIGALLYRFYRDRGRRFIVSGLLFTKYPTGISSGLSPTQLALGTGSFDAGLAILPEWEFGRWDMRWSAFYIVRGRDEQQVDLGDVVSASWSTAYNFTRDLIVEGTFLYKQVSRDDANPRCHLLQFIPAAQYRLARTLLIQLVVPVTIDSKAKFSADHEIWLGGYYML